jgi:hypothetical protein
MSDVTPPENHIVRQVIVGVWDVCEFHKCNNLPLDTPATGAHNFWRVSPSEHFALPI